MRKVLDSIDHRPWPLPRRPWVLPMRWLDLLFAHWPVPAEPLRGRIPKGLELQTFGGTAWVGVVPFRMEEVRPRGFPSVPGVSAFPELNVRTYVTAGGKPGVWFFSLDAAQPLAVRLARSLFHLPYMDARMRCRAEGDWVAYESLRTHRGEPEAELKARYRPVGEVYRSTPGSLEHWLTERYCLYSADLEHPHGEAVGLASRATPDSRADDGASGYPRGVVPPEPATAQPRGRVWRGEIHHAPWPLQRAEAEIEVNTMTEWLGLELTGPPLLHFARRLDVAAWWLEPVRPSGPVNP